MPLPIVCYQINLCRVSGIRFSMSAARTTSVTDCLSMPFLLHLLDSCVGCLVVRLHGELCELYELLMFEDSVSLVLKFVKIHEFLHLI